MAGETLMQCPACHKPMKTCDGGFFCTTATCWKFYPTELTQAYRQEGATEALQAPVSAGKRKGGQFPTARKKQFDYAVVLTQQLWAWAQCQPGTVQFSTEFLFHAERKWRFDVAFERERLAAEVDGGNRLAVISKRTGRPVAIGYHTEDGDYEKLNEAILLGWRVLRFSPSQVKSGYALTTIERALKGTK